MKDILIVTEDPIGIMEILKEGIKSFTDLSYDYIDHYAVRRGFRYRSFGHRATNFFLKTFRGRNLKHEYYHQSIADAISGCQPYYEKILVIRPDILDDTHMQMLRDRTSNLIAYYWDSVEFFPRKKQIIPFFDRILSFDPADCMEYKFEFLPNFYFYEGASNPYSYDVYNLSSYDKRRPLIEEVARQLDSMHLRYVFKGFSDKPFQNNLIRYTPKITYQQMISEIREGRVLLDVSKAGQKGLTMRPMEALGLGKKLITTNSDIRNYSFYDPQNIMIIDPAAIQLDPEFFNTPYKPVPETIKERFHVRTWLARIFDELPQPDYRKIQ